ncbi:glycosyltransferase family 9 protein [bacterium]|nr:glycosyltransferase family 9 protein [bacterium]
MTGSTLKKVRVENLQPLLDDIRDKLTSGQGKILVIQTAFLGDVILVTPLLRSIKSVFPDAELTVVVIPECADVLDGMADVIILFDKREKTGRTDCWHDLIDRLRKEKYDVAFVPHRSFRSGLTAYKAGIPCRIGFKRGWASLFHTHRIAYQFNLYEGIRNLALLDVLSSHDDNGIPELNITSHESNIATDLLAELGLKEGEFVVLAPGSVWTSKRWSVDNFRQISRILEREFSLPVLAIGGSGDKQVCSAVVSIPERNTAGMLSLLGSTAVIARARFIISGDSAPAHLATAVGTRQVIIFGSTSPRFGFAPPVPTARIVETSLWCRPCSNHGRNFCPRFGSYRCLSAITPEMVINEVHDWL